MKSQSFAETVLLWFYPLIMASSLLIAINIVDLSQIYYFFIVAIMFIAFHYLPRSHSSYGIKVVVWCFIIYTLTSGFFNLFSNLTLGYLFNEIKMFIIPILFVFVGLSYTGKDLYIKFLYSTLFCLLMGFLLYVLRPEWYVNFLVRVWNDTWYSSYQSIENANTIMDAFRFSSFFSSSYAISYYSSFALCIVLDDMVKTEEKRLIEKRHVQLTIVISCLFGSILSFHRVAMVFQVFLLVYYFLYCVKKKNPAIKYFAMMLLGLFVVIAVSLPFMVKTDMMERIVERIGDTSFSKAMEGDRTNQNEEAIASWKDVIWGDGTGSKGAFAMQDRLPAITDGNYTKILVENGVVGLSIFMFMAFMTVKRGIKYFNIYKAELFIVVYTLLSMTGANSLCISYHFVLIFWFALGRIWNKKLLLNKKSYGNNSILSSTIPSV